MVSATGTYKTTPSARFVYFTAVSVLQFYIILSHLRSKEPPGLHFVCSPATRATSGQQLYKWWCQNQLWGSISTHKIRMHGLNLAMKTKSLLLSLLSYELKNIWAEVKSSAIANLPSVSACFQICDHTPLLIMRKLQSEHSTASLPI